MMNPILLLFFWLFNLVFLFPLKDKRGRYRSVSWMTLALIAINVGIHLGLLYMTRDMDAEAHWALILPFMETAQDVLDRRGLGALSVLSSAFLHAGWSHLLGNMFILWFFGRKVEDLLGPLRFGLFYLLCALTSGLLSVAARAALSSWNAQIPGLGASGAITGVMGAYLFLYPGEKILTFISAVVPVSGAGGCCLPLPIPIWLPSWVYIVYQMFNNALWGQVAQELSQRIGYAPLGTNVFAHLGGGLGGLICVYFFLPPEVVADRRQSGRV